MYTADNIDKLNPGFEGKLGRGRINVLEQEALRNIAKHSGSAEATVSLVIDAAEFRLRISDRGRGFILKDAYKSGGLGLSSMEERAHLLGGTLAIESDLGKGTSILLRAPLAIGSGKARKAQGTG